jgi:single-strand DNA-binding protein
MAGSVNKVILIGNLGADLEIRRTQDGRPIANLRVATSVSWSDKTTGERREKTEWHRVLIFNEGLCKIAEQYLKKGAKMYLEGRGHQVTDAVHAWICFRNTSILPNFPDYSSVL